MDENLTPERAGGTVADFLVGGRVGGTNKMTSFFLGRLDLEWVMLANHSGASNQCQGRPVPCRAQIWWIRAVPNISVPCPDDPCRAKYFRAVP